MLDARDTETIYAIRALRDIANEQTRPLVLWIGAGASRWCGYPGWGELADTFHTRFLKTEKSYDIGRGLDCLSSRNFPGVFELCKDSNRSLYNQLLVNSFGLARKTPVYDRFIDLLRLTTPVQIVTTNVDEVLEKSLPGTITVQRSDAERVPDLIARKEPFVCKMHGTISSIETAVFTTGDYKALLEDNRCLELNQFLFSNCCTVFLGYGLSDDYLLRALAAASSRRPFLVPDLISLFCLRRMRGSPRAYAP